MGNISQIRIHRRGIERGVGREYACDGDFKLSSLRDGLAEVPQLNGGHIVSIKQDSQQVFPFS